MFPDFKRLEAEATAATKRSEERHQELMAVQREILEALFQLQDLWRAGTADQVEGASPSPPDVLPHGDT